MAHSIAHATDNVTFSATRQDNVTINVKIAPELLLLPPPNRRVTLEPEGSR